MTKDEAIRRILHCFEEPVVNLSTLNLILDAVIHAERSHVKDQLDTILLMYQQVCSQRDQLMDQHKAQEEATRGRLQ